MLPKTTGWLKRAHFAGSDSSVSLGFGLELWAADPACYEGSEQLRKRYDTLGRKYDDRTIVERLSQSLLDDVLVAAGGIERAMAFLHLAIADLQRWVVDTSFPPVTRAPVGLGHEAATEGWYAFTDILIWSRSLLERLDRNPYRTPGPRQGLIPALAPGSLKEAARSHFENLLSGPVGTIPRFGNFSLHVGLLQHPWTGAKLDSLGNVTMPMPNPTEHQIAHWLQLSWDGERDAIGFAEELWLQVQGFVDALLDAFEEAIPPRFR